MRSDYGQDVLSVTLGTPSDFFSSAVTIVSGAFLMPICPASVCRRRPASTFQCFSHLLKNCSVTFFLIAHTAALGSYLGTVEASVLLNHPKGHLGPQKT